MYIRICAKGLAIQYIHTYVYRLYSIYRHTPPRTHMDTTHRGSPELCSKLQRPQEELEELPSNTSCFGGELINEFQSIKTVLRFKLIIAMIAKLLVNPFIQTWCPYTLNWKLKSSIHVHLDFG